MKLAAFIAFAAFCSFGAELPPLPPDLPIETNKVIASTAVIAPPATNGLLRIHAARYTPRSAASVGAIGNNLFVLARNSPPAGFYSDVNLAFACAGHGITPTQYTNLLTIVNRYQTILGRSVP